uniref:Cation/H+ exchanger domain-containing protein n=1 Tax=Panagrolaimus sp. ES5 TaxID=591445 RepID=A0AC34GZ28_9BILA
MVNIRADEESQLFDLQNIESNSKKKSWIKRIWLEFNKIIVYLLFLVSIILTALSILNLYSFSLEKTESEIEYERISLFGYVVKLPGISDTETKATTPTKQIQTCIFSILIFLVTSIGISHVFEKFKMPGLLGILLLGILFRNVPIFHRNFFVNETVASFLRKCAFIIILLRAGLGLDPKALKKLKSACFMLAILPCTFEAFTVAILSMLLFNISFWFGLLLGFILGTVTTAVTVPAMLDLQAKNLGSEQGIPTLINAASSFDDVYALTWVSVLLSSIKLDSGDDENHSHLLTIVFALFEVIGGGILGCIMGKILCIFPSPELSNLKLRRMTLLLSFSMAAFFGMEFLRYEIAGPFAVLVQGFIAAYYWNQQKTNSEPLREEEEILKIGWKYFGLPLLFSLIGYQLDLNQLNKSNILQSILVLVLGLCVRCIVSVYSLFKTKLNFKEKFFVSIAWLPKATIQAVLAPIIMDLIRENPTKYEKYETEGKIILTATILSILITAPAGAILIRLLGPLMLKKSNEECFDSNGNSVQVLNGANLKKKLNI